MIDYKELSNDKPIINYDTTSLTSSGYELKFALDFENPILQEVINRCKENGWLFEVVDTTGRQKHVWIKGWVRD